MFCILIGFELHRCMHVSKLRKYTFKMHFICTSKKVNLNTVMHAEVLRDKYTNVCNFLRNVSKRIDEWIRHDKTSKMLWYCLGQFNISTMDILNQQILCCRGTSWYCRKLSRIPRLYLLDARGNPPVVKTQNIFRHYEMFPGEQKLHPLLLRIAPLLHCKILSTSMYAWNFS